MHAAELREKALSRLRSGRLTPAALGTLAGHRVELLYDVVELPYGDADIEAVDTVRALAIEAAQLIVEQAD